MPPHRLTQHKRFVPYGTYPNSAFGGTSFMLEPLSKIGKRQMSTLNPTALSIPAPGLKTEISEPK